ncbi:ribose-5-phosphate isomerase RpiA [Paenibacillus sedimenti]|uniref:Ribose-5-phosphate isomerase A n=1 Tax=Paenibacillus sedimenti TaxID=2770274 RepID=A0A926KRY1_9BACL|nr:ribose-5-phosphate isomerase RpiA [Paenibacillus sedimenti]MBD0382997.1 ribose-5-phosphate isomerase RpiA [Paenibacillus sedimenti]
MNPKRIAAERAVEFVKDGMIVGLGTGSTSYWAIHRIAEKVNEGLEIKAVASSRNSEDMAMQLGIPLIAFDEIDIIDITIDGADEVDRHGNLTKGGGGALLREKILAANSKQFIVIADETKRVELLGKFPLPVEIVPFAANLTINQLKRLQCDPVIRLLNGKPFMTDNGNLIVDCKFESIPDPEKLTKQINTIPGVAENGLFAQMANKIVTGYNDGRIEVKER